MNRGSLCGCPTACYGFAVGHVRDNVAAMSEEGLARAAATPRELERALREMIASGPLKVPPLGALPRAAEVVMQLGQATAACRAR